jgi:molybdopterin molybdotransferase
MRAKLSLEEDRYVVTTTGPQGSGILNSMVEANSLVIVPEEVTEIKAGRRFGFRFWIEVLNPQ